MLRVKICGITNMDDAIAAADAGVDALGFNFWKNSKRYIEPEAAGEIVKHMPPFITPVGVFVNSSEEEIIEAINASRCSTIQLHGDESPGFVKIFSRVVIKAFRLVSKDEIKQLDEYPLSSYLLDTPSRGYGGTGATCDWDVAAIAAKTHRIILAGGLTPDNVVEAVKKVRPFAVDVAGGVEKELGIKDHKKIRAFVNAARNA